MHHYCVHLASLPCTKFSTRRQLPASRKTVLHVLCLASKDLEKFQCGIFTIYQETPYYWVLCSNATKTKKRNCNRLKKDKAMHLI